MKIYKNSIIAKSAVIYLFLTILNVSIFTLMVFENQLDLIAENAILSSQHTATSLKYRIDNTIAMKEGMSPIVINKILKECGILGVTNFTMYDEGGSVFVSLENNTITNRKMATNDELKMINMAINCWI